MRTLKNVCIGAVFVMAAILSPSFGQGQSSNSSKANLKIITPNNQYLSKNSSGYRGPFSTVGIGLHAGTLGVGVDIATPLARKFNLRGSADFFSYLANIEEDGVNYNAALNWNSGQIMLDWFPIGGFHISPGVLLMSNMFDASLNVPGGNKFSLGAQDYYSSSADNVRGTGHLSFARLASPELKLGFGNIIPRSGRHWSVPFEFGLAYIGDPSLAISVAGTGCQNSNGTNCSNLATDPTAQKNITEEQRDLNEDLKHGSVYPLLSLGVSYKF